jgi:hypothetical protein
MIKTIAAVEPLEIGKQDKRGRRLADGNERRRLLAAFDASGLTQQAFTRQEGINYYTFAGWLRQRRLAQLEPTGKKPAFVELGLRTGPGFPLEVTLPGGVIVRGTRPAELVALVRGLRRCLRFPTRGRSTWRWSRWTCASILTGCGPKRNSTWERIREAERCLSLRTRITTG